VGTATRWKARILIVSSLFTLFGVRCVTAETETLGSRIVFGLQAAYGLENDIPRNISHINMLYALGGE